MKHILNIVLAVCLSLTLVNCKKEEHKTKQDTKQDTRQMSAEMKTYFKKAMDSTQPPRLYKGQGNWNAGTEFYYKVYLLQSLKDSAQNEVRIEYDFGPGFILNSSPGYNHVLLYLNIKNPEDYDNGNFHSPVYDFTEIKVNLDSLIPFKKGYEIPDGEQIKLTIRHDDQISYKQLAIHAAANTEADFCNAPNNDAHFFSPIDNKDIFKPGRFCTGVVSNR